MIDNGSEKICMEETRLSKTECNLLGMCALPETALAKETIDKLHILIVKKINDEKCFHYSVEIIKIIQSYKSQIYVESSVVDEIKLANLENFQFEDVKRFDPEKDELKIDLLITIGGDGTILWSLRYFQHRVSPPIITFDKGSIGYMCNFSLSKFEETLRQIFNAIIEKKTICVETKSRISCEIKRKDEDSKHFLALNEGLLDRGPSPLAVKLDCYLEDHLLTTFDGDGVIISTPNGSTAYQLSAGGPVLHQTVPGIIITPICSHSLSARPIVLPNNLNITIKLSKEARNNAWFSCDGLNRIEIRKDDTLVITKTEYNALFVTDGSKVNLDNWLLRLRNIICWNSKKLNYYDNLSSH